LVFAGFGDLREILFRNGGAKTMGVAFDEPHEVSRLLRAEFGGRNAFGLGWGDLWCVARGKAASGVFED
jgi:hypothetical protein